MQIKDDTAAAAHLFVKYCVAGVGYPPGLSDPCALSFAKIASAAVQSSFLARYFLSEQFDRHRVILTDTLCRSGSSGGKERRKTCIIPNLRRLSGWPFICLKAENYFEVGSTVIPNRTGVPFSLPSKRICPSLVSVTLFSPAFSRRLKVTVEVFSSL